jgi:hypothetical protein
MDLIASKEDMKNDIRKDDKETIKKITAEIEDSEEKPDMFNKFIAEIENLTNNYKCDEAMKLLDHVEPECISNIKVYYLAARIYVLKEQWKNVERIRTFYIVIVIS